MKTIRPLLLLFTASYIIASCSRKVYVASNFDEKTREHTIVAIMPAEMIFTGRQPARLTPEEIAKIEEQESLEFQVSLYNSVLRHANTRKYITTVNFQDANTTLRLLKENNISIRDSWKMDDRKISNLLGVDGIVRMQIRKKRYMSDEASYAVDAGTRIIRSAGIGSKIPIPYGLDKTNDIYASCNLVSNGIGLWNDNYRATTDWDTPAHTVIGRIADEFGSHFPYKRKRRR